MRGGKPGRSHGNVELNKLFRLRFMMLASITTGQKIIFQTRKYRIITVVERRLVCLEPLEPIGLQPRLLILPFEQVLQESDPLEE